VDPIILTTTLQDQDSAVSAEYRLSPAQAAADPEQVGKALYLLADRVTHGLGLPTPRDVEDLERGSHPVDPEPENAGGPRQTQPERLDVILHALQAGSQELEDQDAVEAQAARNLLQDLRTYLRTTVRASEKLVQLAQREGRDLKAERLAEALDALRTDPLYLTLTED